MIYRRFNIFIITLVCTAAAIAETIEPIRYGDMEQWVTRVIKESPVIGGNQRMVYAIAPDSRIEGNTPYTNQGGSPWASSNVMAKVSGIVKTSNAVYPDSRPGGGRCAKLTSQIETCKVIGIINIDVMVAGSIFLGKMLEPIKSTSDPYKKMEMGIPFTKRPKALVFDYELTIPNTNTRIYSSGFSKKRTIQGHDNAEVFILLQRRWEDADGNIYAKRVGTGRELLSRSTNGWINKHHLDIHYGNITNDACYKPFMALIPKDKSYYARNSKGEMVPVQEVDWDSTTARPTHIIMMFSAGSGEPYVGTPGLTLRIDNVCLAY